MGEGLTLRQATADDTDAAAEFQAQVHLPHVFAESFRIWTRDLMSGALPGFQPGDFTVAKDTRSAAILSMLNLIPQTWSYSPPERRKSEIHHPLKSAKFSPFPQRHR